MNRLARHLAVLMLVVAGLAASATNAFATHFRYGTITWSTPNPAQPNVITVRFDSAWRLTYLSPTPTVGQVLTGVSLNGIDLDILNTGGVAVAASVPINPTVTAVNAAEDWMSTTWSQTIALPGGVGSDFILQMTQCCRVSTITDANHDQTFTVLSRVTIRNPINRPPTSASLPVITTRVNQPLNFVVPAFDPDGDTLTYSLTPLAESGLVIQAPGGSPGMTVHPASGRVTWTPTIVGLFSVQFKVTDTKGATGVIDILFSVVNLAPTLTAPTMTLNSAAPPSPATFSVVRGSHLSFLVGASTNTSPASSVTLNSSSLPIGATMSPSLPTSNVPAVSSTFNWTPASNQLGSYIIQYSAVSAAGLQTLMNININVTNNVPTLTCSPTGIVPATGPAGASVTISNDLADADDDLLTYQLTIDGVPQGSQNGLNPPLTRTLTRNFAIGVHTFIAQVTDSFSPTVTCSATFEVKDLTPPTLTLPADISLIATSASGAVATFTASATDVVDTTPAVSCTPASGSTFPIGTTTVQCTATDDALNSTTGSFTVTVTQASTSLSPLTITPNTLVGSLIEFTTTLTRTSPPAGATPMGQSIRWVLTGPGPADTLTQGSMTTSAGYAYLPFTPTQRGVYSLTAYFDGGGELASSQSATTTFTVYQRTQLFISTANGTVGESLVERADLIALPQGATLAGSRTVNFSYTGPSPVPSEDVAGVGSYVTHPTFPLPGIYSLTTTYGDAADFITDAAGTIPPVPTVASASITVNPIFTQLADLGVFTTSSLVGTDVTVSTQLSPTGFFGPPLPGRPVVFTLTAPSGATTSTAATAAFGQVSVVFPLLERGVHTVVANYAGDATTTPSSSNVASFSVYQQTQLVIPAVSGVAGGTTTLAAALMLVPQNTPLPNEPIQFSSSGLAAIAIGTTDGSGAANAIGVFPSSGTYPVQASFDGSADFFIPSNGDIHQAQTATNVATITAAASNVSVTAPASALVAGPLTINATLTRTAAPAGPVDNSWLVFRLTAPSSAVTELWAATDASGMASVTFTPTERGVHTVSVNFSGNAALAATTSAPSSISVFQRTVLTLAPTSGGTNALPVIATFVAVPQNTPLNNQQIQFSFGGVVPTQSAQTNAAGAATVMVTFSTTGTFASQAVVFNAADFLTDAAGAIPPVASTAASTITITDATPPAITPIVTGTLGSNGWYTGDVTLSWSVTDPETAIISSAGCGTTTTTVDGLASFTCTATSSGGTTSQSVSFKRDATAPAQALPANLSVGATTASGAIVNFTVTRSDATSGVASASCTPASGSQFAIGTTTVNCSVTDNAGLTSSGSFTVTVTDTIAPVITSAAPSQSSMWPPDHRMVTITFAVAATDNLGVAPVCTINGITSNEPQNGLGDGDTPNDWLITGPLSAQMRAERAGGGNGRVYTATIRCVDGSGNAATRTATVSVPKSSK